MVPMMIDFVECRRFFGEVPRGDTETQRHCLGLTMRKQPVTRRHFLGSGIAAVGAISIGGALPANVREREKYSARFDRSISDGLPAGPLRPDDETAWKAVAKNYDVTTPAQWRLRRWAPVR